MEIFFGNRRQIIVVCRVKLEVISIASDRLKLIEWHVEDVRVVVYMGGMPLKVDSLGGSDYLECGPGGQTDEYCHFGCFSELS